MMNQTVILMSMLEFPQDFMTKKHIHMFLLILFPILSKKNWGDRQYFPGLAAIFSDIRQNCYDIFKENTILQRQMFFKEPLI